MSGAQWTFGDAVDSRLGSGSGSGSRSGLRPGELFDGRFEIQDVIGEGGMGRVLRAVDVVTGQPVAIKVLRRALNEAQLKRFAREGQLTAGFQHPGIVRVYGGGLTAQGQPFLVLELLEDAKSLTEASQREPGKTLDLLLEVILAVGYAHRCGIVHRDLKPDNVIVPADGRPRVCDFGLAWQAGVADLTQTGQLLGTPLYMAPERFRDGVELRDPTLDVWSLGVMLYEALTGVHPLKPKTGNLLEFAALASSARIAPPSSHDPTISPQLDAVCLRALARDPLDRYANAGELAEALEGALYTTRQARSSRGAWILAVVGAALLASLATALALRSGDPELAAPASPTADRGPPTAAPTAPASPAPTPTADRGPPPDPDEARRRLPTLLRDAHRPLAYRPEVHAAFEELRALARTDPPLRKRIELERLAYRFRRGHWTQVVGPLQQLVHDPGDLGDRAAVYLGLTMYELGRREDGARVCRERRERNGSSATAWSRTVAAWERIFNRNAGAALAEAKRAQQVDPKLAEAILAEACAYGLLIQLDKSWEVLQRLRPIAPDHPTRLRLVIACHLTQGKLDAGLRASEELIALTEPEPPATVLLDYAGTLYGKRDFTAANAAANRVLKRNPRHFRARFLLAVVRLQGRGPRQREVQLEVLRGLYSEDPAAFKNQLSYVDPLPFRNKIRRAVMGQ